MDRNRQVTAKDLPVRLSAEEKNGLIAVLGAQLDRRARVWLFGSRADLQAKGGDIDLYLEFDTPLSDALGFARRLALALEQRLGERKIDLVFGAPNLPVSALHQIAKQRGVLIWAA